MKTIQLEYLKVNTSLMKLETSNKESVPPNILHNFSLEHGNELMAHGFSKVTSAH
jgi:hypothetical protein